jgi:folate-binding protein YgfZ
MNQDWTTFLASQGVAADGSDFGDLRSELNAAGSGNVLAPLLDHGLIRASGTDATDFLHNLLTNDVRGLGAANARFAGMCTAKGRLLAVFLVWRDGDDFLLMLPRDVLPAILKKLSMYVLRAKVKLTDAVGRAESGRLCLQHRSASADFGLEACRAHGVAEYSRRAGNSAGCQSLAAGPGTGRGHHRLAVGVCRDSAQSRNWQPGSGWRSPQGQARILAGTQEAFVPQMLNMELPAVGGVSFTKGCYPGQEIVARTQYLGKVKRRSFRARLVGASGARHPCFCPGDRRSTLRCHRQSWRHHPTAVTSAWFASRLAPRRGARYTLAPRLANASNFFPCPTPSRKPSRRLRLACA